MLYFTIALFAVSAILGLAILVSWLTKKDAPRSVVYSHGIGAAIGLALLIVYALQNPSSFPKISIVLFVVAAIAGFYMFFNDLQKKPSPLAVAFVHALVAAGGFVALLFFVFA
jgi:hypothetical protein